MYVCVCIYAWDKKETWGVEEKRSRKIEREFKKKIICLGSSAV